MSDLVERLLQAADMRDELKERYWHRASSLKREAAAELSRLKAERDELSAWKQLHAGDVLSLSNEVRDLTEQRAEDEARIKELEAERDAAVLAEREACHQYLQDQVEKEVQVAEALARAGATEALIQKSTNRARFGIALAQGIRSRTPGGA
ncbi:hypothetical protein ABLE91_05515 [Aquabacter sp. CN5-332]|uniref:hypothetical protein n=1 Tax=Aquabacter sp. CN5-332 TaxID=3156608 RepID=UPI0032B4022F